MSPSGLSHGRRRLLEADAPAKPGEVVGGKYRIEAFVAAGGMGVVAAARHEVLGHRVAIKFLLPRAGADDAAARFLREARAAARIQSERVVRVFDCGTLASGVPYMVMEHLEGMELSSEMRTRGRYPIAEAVDLVLDALEGVAAAHALGIVHRDLKPSNLFLVDEPGGGRRVKVLDFGISKLEPGPDEPVRDDLTQTSMVLGSPRYISPEQAKSSRDVDARADIWSMGVILYQLLAGEAPFQGDTIGEILANILLHTPERLDARRPEIGAALAQTVARCLRREREERFEDVAALAQELAPHGGERARAQALRIEAMVCGGADQLERPTRPQGFAAAREEPSAESAGSATLGSWTQATGTQRRGGRWWLALVAVALVLGLYGGWRWQSARLDEAGAASAPPAAPRPETKISAPPAETAAARDVEAAPSASASPSRSTAPPPALPRVKRSEPRPTPAITAPPSAPRPEDVLRHSD